jgi:predicted nucleic acid-binding protein
MERICSSCQIVGLSDAIIRETIKLRTHNRIKLPDAIIYATAIAEGGPLFTNNISDFKNLPSKVELINPFNL